MEYTEQQKAVFKQQFAERRRWQIILAVPLVALFFAFAFFADDKNKIALPGVPIAMVAPVLFAVFIGAIVFSPRN